MLSDESESKKSKSKTNQSKSCQEPIIQKAIIRGAIENSPSGKLIKISMSSTATTLDENAFGSVLGLLVRKYGQPDSKKSFSIAKTSLWLKTSGQLEFQTMFDRASPNSAFVLCIIDYIAVVSDANRL